MKEKAIKISAQYAVDERRNCNESEGHRICYEVLNLCQGNRGGGKSRIQANRTRNAGNRPSRFSHTRVIF